MPDLRRLSDVPTVKVAADIPMVKMVGGTTGVATKVYVDDVEQRGVTHVSLDVGLRESNEVVIERRALLDIAVQANVRDRWDMLARLSLPGLPPREFHGQGGSLAEAIRDIAAMVGHAERDGDFR